MHTRETSTGLPGVPVAIEGDLIVAFSAQITAHIVATVTPPAEDKPAVKTDGETGKENSR